MLAAVTMLSPKILQLKKNARGGSEQHIVSKNVELRKKQQLEYGRSIYGGGSATMTTQDSFFTVTTQDSVVNEGGKFKSLPMVDRVDAKLMEIERSERKGN